MIHSLTVTDNHGEYSNIFVDQANATLYYRYIDLFKVTDNFSDFNNLFIDQANASLYS